MKHRATVRARIGRPSEAERLRPLAAFDEHVGWIPERPLAEVEAELDEIRRARRGGDNFRDVPGLKPHNP